MRSWAARRVPRSRAGTTRSRSRAASSSRIRTAAPGRTGRSSIPRTTVFPACPIPAIRRSPSWYYVKRGLELLWSLAASLPLSDDERRAAHLSRDDGERSLREWLRRPFGELADRARDAVHGAGLAALVAAIALAGSIESVAVDHLPGVHERLLRLLQSFIEWVRDRARPWRRRGRPRVPHRAARRDRRGLDPWRRDATTSSPRASRPSTITSSSTGSGVTARPTTPSSRPS